MNRDEWQNLKGHLDKGIYGEIKLSSKERRNILNKTLGKENKSPFNWFTHSMAVLATILLFGIISSYYLQQNDDNTASYDPSFSKEQINTKGNTITAKEKIQILKDVDLFKTFFRIGMNENEIFNLAGKIGHEIIPGKTEDEGYFIEFERYRAPGTPRKKLDFKPETYNIKDEKIGLQIIIRMNKDKKAEDYSLLFLEDNKVVMQYKSAKEEYNTWLK